MICAADGVVVVEVPVGDRPPEDGGPVVVGDGTVVDVDVLEGVPDGADADGKNGTHRAKAVEARPRSAVMALWALVTPPWAAVRPWPGPAPDRPDGLVTRGLMVAVGVLLALAVPPVLAVPEVLPLALVADVDAVWSDSSVAFVLARDAWSVVTALRSGTGSSVASVWPAVTASPTETGTLVTVPATGKLSLTWLTRWTEPVRLRRCSTEPIVAVVVRYVSTGLALALARVTTVPAITRMAAMPAGSDRRTHVRCRYGRRVSGTGAAARRGRGAAGPSPAESAAES